MICLRMDASGSPIVDHVGEPPLVSLDHCALMEIAEQHAEAFDEALKGRNGTLALSWLNLLELADVSDRTAATTDSLIRRVWPRVAFLEVLPEDVIAREDILLAGRPSTGAPHLDVDLLKTFLYSPPASLNPVDPTGFIEQFRDPDLVARLKVAWTTASKTVAEATNRNRASYRSDPAARGRVAKMVRGPSIEKPTRYILREAGRYLIKGNFDLSDGHNIRDFLHTVVPLSYCDYVVLDGQWKEAARQMQDKVKNAGLLTHSARVFSSSEIPNFLSELVEPSERLTPNPKDR